MPGSISSILFATDLSQKCIPAFDFAASLAVQYQADIILLHLTEKIPNYVESRLKDILGQEEFEKISRDHEKSIQQTLIAKKSSDKLIEAALGRLLVNAGVPESGRGISRTIVIKKGEVSDEIIAESKKHECGIIILAGRKSILKKTAIGSTIKDVLRRATVPVVVVPSGESK